MLVSALPLVLGGTVAAAASPALADSSCSAGFVPQLYTDSNVYVVGQSPHYTVFGPANCPLYWSSWRLSTSTYQWYSTGEVNSYYGQSTDSGGYWPGDGNAWQSSDTGYWEKQVMFGVGGPTATVFFQVSG